jgi:subtilisin family serine protease
MMVKRSLLAMMLILTGAAGCDGGSDATTFESTANAPVETQAKVSPGIAADVNAGRARDVIVVLADEPVRIRRSAFHATIPHESFARYLADVTADLDGLKSRVLAAAPAHIEPLHSYENLPVMHVRLHSAAALAALEAHADVVAVVEDRALQAFDTTPTDLTLIGQPTVAAAGKLGAGSTVAVLDTGTDYKRAPFNCTAPGAPSSCPVVYAQDFATQDNALDTGSFHGTNVSGIVLSVAPSAKIIALDVFDGDYAYTSVILSAINWVVQNKAKYNIVAINMSLGGGLFTSQCTLDPFAAAVAAARSAGVLSAIASGNSASSTSISTPACVPGAVSVGAVYAGNVGPLYTSVCTDLTSAADKVACFSNSASFLTILAPGVGITAAGITMSGTSQATPHVAGAIALLAAAFPTATPDALVTKLTTSKTTITDARNSVKTPRLDLPSALAATAAAVAPSGNVVINAGAGYTKATVVSVDVTTTSGTAAKVCLSTSATCTAWVTYAKTQSFTVPSGDGNKTINVWWKDASGTASTTPKSASIILDTTAPTGGSVTNRLVSTVDTMTWSGFADSGSGVASYKLVSATTSAPANCSVGTARYTGSVPAFAVSNLPTGTTYFRLCAVDNAGNMGTGITTSVTVAATTRR